MSTAAVELRHAALLPVWLTDLAAPDALVSFSTPIGLPILGVFSSFNLLPILLAVVLFLHVGARRHGSPGASARKTRRWQLLVSAAALVALHDMPSALLLCGLVWVLLAMAERYWLRGKVREQMGRAGAAPDAGSASSG
jgi:membrane protein insertase Oxa1/YidC/SpoIIIJ